MVLGSRLRPQRLGEIVCCKCLPPSNRQLRKEVHEMQACPGTPLHTRCGTSATNKEISKIHVRVYTKEHTYDSPVQGISMIQFFYRDGSQALHGSDLCAGARVRLHSLQAAVTAAAHHSETRPESV